MALPLWLCRYGSAIKVCRYGTAVTVLLLWLCRDGVAVMALSVPLGHCPYGSGYCLAFSRPNLPLFGPGSGEVYQSPKGPG